MPEISEKIKQKLDLLPDKPGCYLMKDAEGKIIYIGKAKVLKNRIRSYFIGISPDPKTRKLVSKIDIFDYIITATEKQALVLENNLIKKYKPRYNILLKDDKQYPFIKITLNESFPRVFVTRELKKDGGRYFGPYIDSGAVKRTLRLLEWIFPMRTCSRDIPENEIAYQRSCINYQLGKCPAPCIGKIGKVEYMKNIRNIIYFLNGKNQTVIDSLMDEMQELSREMKFEQAAQVRDRVKSIQKLNNGSRAFFTDEKNRDIIGIYKEEHRAAVSVLKVLAGKLLNKEIYSLNNVEESTVPQLLEAFLIQYYSEKVNSLPYRILLQEQPEDFESINELLKNQLIIPQRGEMKALITMARENAFNYVEEQKLKYLRKSTRTIVPVKELKDKLGLEKLPRKMICVDISTIQGTDTVSSLVYFENGKPKKKNYRRFIIKTVEGQNDFACMKETMERYFAKMTEEEKPDLIVIDGGKGQLSSAYSILKAFGSEGIEMISLAKRLEEVFLPGRSDSIILPKSSSALRLLIKIRDEAHRFAVTFHRKRRSLRTLTSELDNIKGVGAQTRFLLLKEFGSVENIKKAGWEELAKVKGLGEKTAKMILEGLKKADEQD